jgi:hypothetical protein
MSNQFAALENLDGDVDSITAWEKIRISKFLPNRV